ncbi:uncharacterized protein LOC109709249 isoform X2 [Ananas comosus]|uniref:Uncharacterized protein LOC109709249 isoform X2 n=1 Tax=Ananas comosus TaxID=4615 RepID=A0A6P5EU12_ANACO|nr:uncharacterized protein LOC109709249 isoform X2 [Ananas comosus]
MLRVSEDGGRRREGYVEIYRQLGRTLLDLQDAADRVFDVISLRTSQEQDKLSEISRRIQVAKAKIDSLSRSEQALTVISPARYPSTCIVEENFPPLFQYSNEGNEPGFPVAKLLVDGGLNREYGRDCTLELFQFFSEENISYPSMESDLKGGVKLTEPNNNISLQKIFEATRFLSTDKSTSTSESESKSEELPPPPPSLLLKNSDHDGATRI